MNYAWIYTFEEESHWSFVNSVADLRDAPTTLRFEYGNLVTGEHTMVELNKHTLSPVLEAINVWIHQMKAGSLAVYGKRNLFEPLLFHYQRWYGVAVTLGMEDILENYILPGSVPTLDDRRHFTEREAEWFACQIQPSPLEFFRAIIARK